MTNAIDHPARLRAAATLIDEGEHLELRGTGAVCRDAADAIDRLTRDLADARAEALRLRSYNAGLLVIEAEKDAEIADLRGRLAEALRQLGLVSADLGRVTHEQRANEREYDPNVAPCDDAEFGCKP